MGYDVTFHPVRMQDLQHWLFDVVETPSLAKNRAAEISPKENVQTLVAGLYQNFSEWLSSKSEVSATFALGAAILAGCRGPYWYSRGNALSFAANSIPELTELFTPITMIANGKLSGLKDSYGGRINANYTASGVILPERIEMLTKILPRLAPTLPAARNDISTGFDPRNFQSLLVALNFARSNDLGLIEASDVVMPVSGECYTDDENMRAQFLKRMDP